MNCKLRITQLDFQFQFQYVKNLELVTPIMTKKKYVNKIKINNFSYTY